MDEINDESGKQNGSGSLLLFLVPLLGVVLTVLSIIGVKYCLRDNARNEIGLADDNRGLTTREALQPHHRERREWTLMTVDEVNEQFPILKYRRWASERAREELPTFGHLSVPAGRTNGTQDNNGIVLDISVKDRHSTEQRQPSDIAANSTPATSFETDGKKDIERTEPEPKQPANSGQISWTQSSHEGLRVAPDGNDSDGDGHIDAALPAECPSTTGDTCAICVSVLEDDNDIRELTCGHPFHAVCVDPWLTSRRPCCPLCNADCYMSKPRPNSEADSDAATNLGLRNNNQLNLPGAPPAAHIQGSSSNSSHQGTWLIRVGGESRPRRANRDQREGQSLQHGAIPAFGRPENDQHTTCRVYDNETVTPLQPEAGPSEAATSTH